MQTEQSTVNPEILLAEDMAAFYADPLGFVMYAYPWDSDPALHIVELPEKFRARFPTCKYGPDEWACEQLEQIGDEVLSRNFDGKTPAPALRMATTSGHGIGKSALSAWIVDWIMSTRPHAKGTVTANTADQLSSKTWAQIAYWTKKSVTGHWFNITTGKGAMKMYHKQNPDSWLCTAQTCKEENSESFAGQHAANSTSFYLFDEGSAIPEVIYKVAEGGLTDGEPHFYVFGNPTRNTGSFRECFGRMKHRWITRKIDSRKVAITNKAQIQEWIDDYGEDSDFVRVRVKGEFPRAGSMQFIPSDIAEAARKREPYAKITDPVSFGVDVARFGDDESVICIRRGRDATMCEWKFFRGIDTMALAAHVVDLAREQKPDAIFVDGGGVGGGVIDRLKMLRQPVIEVQFGGVADRRLNDESAVKYANKVAEMWGHMKEWLKGGTIPDDSELIEQLTGREYGHVMDKEGNDVIMLEKKKDMKKRGLSSPDRADALALTFAYPIVQSDHSQAIPGVPNQTTHQAEYQYDPRR